MKYIHTIAASLLLAAALPATAQTATPVFVEDGSCKPDNLRWLVDSVTGPVATNWTGVTPMRRHEVLVPEAARAGLQVKRIVMFGDMVGMWADTPAIVHPEVRAIYGRADLVIGNIEAPITTYRPGEPHVTNGLKSNSSQFYNFHVPRQFLRSITSQYCIDPKKSVFSVANNHANDRGDWPQTLAATAAMQASDGFRFAGVDADPMHNPEIAVFDSGALRVGVVAWTHLDNTPPALNPDGSVQRPTWQASRKVEFEWDATTGNVDTTRHRDFTRRKRALGLDMLIGMPHWGCEFQSYPKPYQIQKAAQFARSGFDMIVGSHPGVMQTASLIEGDPNKLAFYSLGVMNKLFNWFSKPALITAVELLVDENGRTLEYTVHPFIQRRYRESLPLPTTIDCGGRVTNDFPRSTKDEVVTLARAYREAGGNTPWKVTDIDAAVRVFRQVFPE